MTIRRAVLILVALALVQHPAAAQEEPTAQEETGSTAILEAIRLPEIAEGLRERGVPVEEIEAAMRGAREGDVPPGEMTGVLEETAESVDETGPIENFGAFVQDRLAAGLRGRDLAEAIRTEHARRGIGQGRMLESRGRGAGGPPGQAGRDRMRPDSAMGPGGMGPGGMMGDSMADTAGRRGPPMGAGQRGGRPDSTPRGQGQGGGQGNSGQGGGLR